MFYTVATNFDNSLIQEIARYDSVESVYGKLQFDLLGGGRVGHVLPKISLKKMGDHITCCHQKGIRFNYLLNAPCLNNMELTKAYHTLFSFIDKIAKAGVDAFTIGNMNLLKMMRRHFPEMTLSTSINMQIRTVRQLRYIEECGANEITLYSNFNRNFELLKAAVEQSRPETRLRIIANNSCLHDCVEFPDHANYIGHSTQSRFLLRPFTYDPFRLNCGFLKIKYPVKLICSDWIRPEDIHHYDAIGHGKIVCKLTDRISPTKWLVNVVKAYSEEKKKGNLMEILNFAGNLNIQQIHKASIVTGMLNGSIQPRNFRKFGIASKLVPVYLDNSKLDGFLEGMQKIDCPVRTCNDTLWQGEGVANGNCNYCREYGEKVLQIDEEKRREAIRVNEQLLEDILTGKF